MTLVEAPRAECLRHQRVQAEQNRACRDRNRVEDGRPKADRADRDRCIRQSTNHHDVDDAHRGPPEFSKRKGNREPCHRPDLFAQMSQDTHSLSGLHGGLLRAAQS